VPQLRGIGFREIGAGEIATLAPTSLSELVTAEPIAERGFFFGELARRTGPFGAQRRASSCTSEKHYIRVIPVHQERLACEGHRRELLEACP
jgi:hypothetical protein